MSSMSQESGNGSSQDPSPSVQDRLHQPWRAADRSAASRTSTPTSSLAASPQYVQQYRALMDHQRSVFDEERALWHTERSEMLEKIAKLEVSLRRYEAVSSSQVPSATEFNVSRKISSGHAEFYARSAKKLTGDEVWRGPGGKSNAQPTRTFTNQADQFSAEANRLPLIAKGSVASKSMAAFFSDNSIDSRLLGKASTSGISTDKDLDGITFKEGVLAPTIAESLVTSQVPQPLRSTSPAGVSSGSVVAPTSLSIASPDPYTKDAGHTPLARRSEYNLDGGSGAALSSGLVTSPQTEVERPPLEPRASTVKIPSECDDSYFSCTEGNNDGDIELQEPLGLKDNAAGDEAFLNSVDSRLRQVAQSETLEPSESGKEDINEDKGFDQPEPEPKLRIKKSMNFGSQFGASSCGKGF